MTIGLDELQDGLSGITSQAKSIITEKPIVTAAVGGATVGAVSLGVAKAVKKRKKAKKSTRKKRFHVYLSEM